jgi:hypothetical protein
LGIWRPLLLSPTLVEAQPERKWAVINLCAAVVTIACVALFELRAADSIKSYRWSTILVIANGAQFGTIGGAGHAVPAREPRGCLITRWSRRR